MSQSCREQFGLNKKASREREREVDGGEPKPEKLGDVQNKLTSLWTSLSSLVVSIGFGSFCIAFKCLQD